MTKPFAGSVVVPGGTQISGGSGYPSAPPGVDLPVGSYYLCDDGSWWKKFDVDATAWVQLRTIAAVNGDSADLIEGMPVASSGDQIVRAQAASAAALSLVVGLVSVGAAPGEVAQFQPADLMQLTQAQWNAVTGGVSGLTPGKEYFLSTTLGMLTIVPPGAAGEYVARVGRAVSATGLVVAVQPAILL